MLIVSGSYEQEAGKPAALHIDIECDGVRIPAIINVHETEDGPAFYLPVSHPEYDDQCVMFEFDSLSLLHAQLKERFEEIKAVSINHMGKTNDKHVL